MAERRSELLTKKKKQLACKPGFVSELDIKGMDVVVQMSVIYLNCVSPHSFSVLPLGWEGLPFSDGIKPSHCQYT